MKKRGMVLLTVVLIIASESRAAVFHDGVSNAQRMVEFIQTTAQELKTYAEMVTTAQRMVEQVRGTYRMIEMAGQHLTNMPQDGNILSWITTMDAQASNLLGQVQYIGFNLDRTTRQFEVLYGNTAMLTTPEGRAERYRQMREARLQMTGLAMQTQSIRQTFGDVYTRLSTILGVSSWAQGTKALQQLQMQQNALAQQQQQLGLTMQAVSARLVTMKHAEEIVLEQMHEQAAAHNAKIWYGHGTATLPAGYNGFMLVPTLGQ